MPYEEAYQPTGGSWSPFNTGDVEHGVGGMVNALKNIYNRQMFNEDQKESPYYGQGYHSIIDRPPTYPTGVGALFPGSLVGAERYPTAYQDADRNISYGSYKGDLPSYGPHQAADPAMIIAGNNYGSDENPRYDWMHQWE